MTETAYTLSDYVAGLRKIAAEAESEEQIIKRVRPLAKRMSESTGWVKPDHYTCDEKQGFGVHLLHEEPDHSLAVFAVAWLPGRGTPPHDHGTWAVVVGVDGPEKNTFWKRKDDGTRPGYAELEHNGERTFSEGEVVAFLTGQIHSVWNESDDVTLSLHTYGRHINFTGRSQFDPDKRTATPFVVKEQ